MNTSARSYNLRPVPQRQVEESSNAEWQSFCWQIKQSMTGSQQEKEDILRRRLLKFFHSFSLEQNRYYVQRRQASSQEGTDLLISSNSIILYGIDFLPQGKVQKYFMPYQVAIDYYDDSHCSVSFQSYDQLLEAIYKRLQRKNVVIDSFETFSYKITHNNREKLAWRELQPYFELCFQRSLWFRFLTSHDYHDRGKMGQTAVHQTYLIAKNNFFKEIQKSLAESGLGSPNNLSRSLIRGLSRSRERGQFGERSRSRESQIDRSSSNYNYNTANNYYVNRQCCNCHCVSKQIQMMINQAQCMCTNSRRTRRMDYNINGMTNYNQQTRRSVIDMSRKYQQPLNPEDIANSREVPSGEKVSRQRKSYAKQNQSVGETTFLEEMERHDDSIGSLVKQLEKYKFDDEPSLEHQVSNFSDRQRSVAFSMREAAEPTIMQEEDTVLEYIQEQ